MGFQKTVNTYPSIGVAGDFASNNPIFSLIAGEGQLQSGAGGVTVGVFGFADMTTGLVTNTWKEGDRVGFVPRALNLALLGYVQEANMVIPQGREITLVSTGDFIVALAQGNVGDHIVASKTDGAITAVDDPTDTTTSVDTGYILATAPKNGLAIITKLG